MFETFCVDISVHSAIVLSEATKPLAIFKILIFKLHKDQLVLENKIRLTGPAYVITPFFSQQSIYIILKNKLLVKYNLYSKQQLIIQIMQYDGNIQLDEIRVMNYGILKEFFIINVINTQNLNVVTYQNKIILDVEKGAPRVKNLLKNTNILYNNNQLQLFQLEKGQGNNPGYIKYVGEIITLNNEEIIQYIVEFLKNIIVITNLNVYIMKYEDLSTLQVIPYKNQQHPYISNNQLILQNESTVLQLYKQESKITSLQFKIIKKDIPGLSTIFVLNSSLHETYNMSVRDLTYLTRKTEQKFKQQIVLYDEPTAQSESQISSSTTTTQYDISMDDAAQCKTIDTVFKAVIHGDEAIEEYMHHLEPLYEESSDRCLENCSDEPEDTPSTSKKKQSLRLQLMQHTQDHTKLNILIDTHNTHSIILDHVKILTYDDKKQMYQISPTVCMYNYHLQKLIFYDVIRFQTLEIQTEPITQFCMACTKSIHFLAYSTYDQTLNISTVTILTINEFKVENVLETYEVYGYVRSICVQHDSFTVCTVVTFDNFVEVHRIEQGWNYSFKCSFPICCAFELLQEGNLYVLDENRHGHFISVPNQLNQQFCLIDQTNMHIFQQFEYMLTIYMSQFRQDGTFAEPIVLPMDTDVEARCFQRNLAKAFCHVIDELRDAYPAHYDPNEPPDEANQQQQQLEIQRQQVAAYIEETSRDVRSYYISHRSSFEINVFNLLQRLSWYLNQMLYAIEVKQSGTVEKLRSTSSSLDIKQSIDASYQPAVQAGMQEQKRYEDAVAGADQIPDIQFPSSKGDDAPNKLSESAASACKASGVKNESPPTSGGFGGCKTDRGASTAESGGQSGRDAAEAQSLERSVAGRAASKITRQQAIDAHKERLDQPSYDQLRQKLHEYSEVDIVSHSAFQTLNYTKLELSDCLSYNFLHIYFQHKKFQATGIVQDVLSNMARRILPFIMKTTLPKYSVELKSVNQGSTQQPASVRVRKFLKNMFGLGDVGDIYLSTDIEHQCYTSQHSSLFTLGFITLFTLFINLDRVEEFLGVKINSSTFKMLEALLQEYLTQQKRFICVRSILDHVSSQEPGPRYSALMLLRLYKMQMCRFWISIDNEEYHESDQQDQCDNVSQSVDTQLHDHNIIYLHGGAGAVTDTQEKTYQDPTCVFDYLRVMNQEIGKIYGNGARAPSFDEIPTAVVALESLVQPLHVVLSRQKRLNNEQKRVIKASITLFNISLHTINVMVSRMDEAKIDQWHEDERLYKYAVLLIHCISYNLFYINTVYLYQQRSAKGTVDSAQSQDASLVTKKTIMAGKGFIQAAQQVKSLLEILLKFSGLLRLMPMRSFVYEQLIQFCIKSTEPWLISEVVNALLAHHRFAFAYKSVSGFLHYARYNYKAVMELWGGMIVKLLLELASQYFKKLVHDVTAKPLLQQLLQMLLNLCKGCDCLNYFTYEQKQLLVYTLEGKLCIFDFHNYALTQYTIEGQQKIQLELVKHAQMDNKVLMVAVSLEQNLLILSNSLFDGKKFLVLPAIPSIACAQLIAQQKDLKLQLTRLTQEFVHSQNIYVTLEVINGQLIISFTNTQIFSLTCYKLTNINYEQKRMPPQAGKYGLYKFKKNMLAYGSSASKTKFISLSMDRDSVKYIIKW